MDLLDDSSRYERFDDAGMGGHIEKAPDYLEDSVERAQSSGIEVEDRPYDNIIVVGVGGSAIGGDIASDWLRMESSIPVYVSRSYRLPAFADERSLIIAVSYSGETYETLNQLHEAVGRGCMVTAVTSGGRLERICSSKHIPFLKVEGGMPPRAALPYLFGSIAYILSSISLVRLDDLRGVADSMRKVGATLNPHVPSNRNPAKSIASTLEGEYPIIFAVERIGSAARRFKDQLNENSKVEAKFDLIPEAYHNEVEGFTAASEVGWRGEKIVLLRDRLERAEEQASIEALKDLLIDLKAPSPLEVWGSGETQLESIFTIIHMVDYISYYLAMVRGVNPTSISTIQRFKDKVKHRYPQVNL